MLEIMFRKISLSLLLKPMRELSDNPKLTGRAFPGTFFVASPCLRKAQGFIF